MPCVARGAWGNFVFLVDRAPACLLSSSPHAKLIRPHIGPTFRLRLAVKSGLTHDRARFTRLLHYRHLSEF